MFFLNVLVEHTCPLFPASGLLEFTAILKRYSSLNSWLSTSIGCKNTLTVVEVPAFSGFPMPHCRVWELNLVGGEQRMVSWLLL